MTNPDPINQMTEKIYCQYCQMLLAYKDLTYGIALHQDCYNEISALIEDGDPENERDLKQLFGFYVPLVMEFYEDDTNGYTVSKTGSITGLALSGCDLKEIPENNGVLMFLQTLDLSNNEITYIPDWIFEQVIVIIVFISLVILAIVLVYWAIFLNK